MTDVTNTKNTWKNKPWNTSLNILNILIVGGIDYAYEEDWYNVQYVC